MKMARLRRLAPLSLLAVPLVVVPLLVSTSHAAPAQTGATVPSVIPAAAKGVLFGTSMGTDGAATIKMFPNSRIGRVFENQLSIKLPALPSTWQIWLSFNNDPATVASGAFNAEFATILQSWNASGRVVYWDWQHEADNPRSNLNPTQIRAGWAQLLSVEKRYPNANVKSMSIYEGYMLHPSKPHGDPSVWYVDADVLGFDCYQPKAVVRAMQYAQSKGKPWSIPEFGNHSGDAGDIAYITSTITSWAAYPPIGAAWFNNTAAANYSQPLSQIPQTLAYLRALAG